MSPRRRKRHYVLGMGLAVAGLALAWYAFNFGYYGDYTIVLFGRVIGIGLALWGMRYIFTGFLAPRNSED